MTDLLVQELRGDIAILRLNRPEKRNAINDPLIVAIRDFFQEMA